MTPREGRATETVDEIRGQGTGVWYCPLCGYIDPKTYDLRCPRPHPTGRHPLFREANYGYFIRIGLEERDDDGSPNK